MILNKILFQWPWITGMVWLLRQAVVVRGDHSMTKS